jgi:surfactin synthase thioesterase subunit
VSEAARGLVQLGGAPDAARAVVCIPQAGAGSGVFKPWLPAFEDVSSLWAACMPGREGRLLEEPLTTIESMADELLEPVARLPANEITLFGHCSGALVAYELTRRLTGETAIGSGVRLVVSSQLSPTSLGCAQPSVAGLPLAQLVERLREIGGTDDEVLESNEFMELLEPAIRGDFQAVESYVHQVGRPRLDIPIVALGGRADSVVTSADLVEWHCLTSGEFGMNLFDAGHSYLVDRQEQVLEYLRGLISG